MLERRGLVPTFQPLRGLGEVWGRTRDLRSLALPHIPKSIMKRHYPDRPLVGVGAVIFREEEVLLVRRGQEPAKGSWSLPGGLVEVGETLEAALKREVMEETGITVRILGITAVLERIYRDEIDHVPYHYVLVDFVCDYVSGAVSPGSDAAAARFFSPAALEALPLPVFTASIIQRARKQKEKGDFLPLFG